MHFYLLTDNTSDSLVRIKICDPVDITLFVLDDDTYISWYIANYASGCSFLVTVWNCSQPDTPLNCTVPDPNQPYVRRLSLNHCLETNHLYYNDTVVDIKWDNNSCVVGDNDCSTPSYIPKPTETG